MNTNEHSAANPQPLPLLHLMEERAGERRRVCLCEFGMPLSSVLSPLLRRGERKKMRAQESLSNMRQPSSLYYELDSLRATFLPSLLRSLFGESRRRAIPPPRGSSGMIQTLVHGGFPGSTAGSVETGEAFGLRRQSAATTALWRHGVDHPRLKRPPCGVGRFRAKAGSPLRSAPAVHDTNAPVNQPFYRSVQV